MAEALESLDVSDLKENFLECSVCLKNFDQAERRPRLLINCLHSFCTKCLEKLLEKNGKGKIICPNCREVQQVKGAVSSLPVDPVRNKLIDYVKFKKGKTIPCSDCQDERNQPTRKHTSHKGKDQDELEDDANSTLSSLRTKMVDAERTVSVLRRKRTLLEKESTLQGINLKHKTDSINKTFDKLIGMMNCQRNELITELKGRTESTVHALKKQLQATEDSLAQIDSTLEFFKEMESKSDKHGVFSTGHFLIQSLEAVIDVDQTQDVQHQSWTFSPGEIDNIMSQVHTFGEINSITTLERTVDESLANLENREVKKIEIPVHGTGSNGLGMQVRSKTSTGPEGIKDDGLFIKSVMDGGAASKDGRLLANDQLLEVNGSTLTNMSHANALTQLRQAIRTDGPKLGFVMLTIARKSGDPSSFNAANG